MDNDKIESLERLFKIKNIKMSKTDIKSKIKDGYSLSDIYKFNVKDTYKTKNYNESIKLLKEKNKGIKYDIEVSSTIICKKCKQKSVTTQLIQTKAGDEDATIIYTCINPNCKHQWIVG